MVDVVPTLPAPTVAVIYREDDLGLTPANGFAQVTSKSEICLDEAIDVIDELHDRYADCLCAASLLLTDRRPLRGLRDLREPVGHTDRERVDQHEANRDRNSNDCAPILAGTAGSDGHVPVGKQRFALGQK